MIPACCSYCAAGEATALGCLPQPSQLGPDVHPGARWGAMQSELVSQIFTGPPQMVLVSTSGVLELERRRPVDVLQELLGVSVEGRKGGGGRGRMRWGGGRGGPYDGRVGWAG